MILRKKTREIHVGRVAIGGNHPITIQSMTKTDTNDVESTLAQIESLRDAGCAIIRIAVKDKKALPAFSEIVKSSPIPVIADIHFDYRIALTCIELGADGIRINPGNIGSRDRIDAVVKKAKERDVAIRIGINAGSLEKDILAKHGSPTPEALVESAMRSVNLFEDLDYANIKLSIKSANVLDTISAYRKISEKVDYPLHVGVTEAGTVFRGSIKSAVGIGVLLSEGIGDTIRVSLTGDPIKEVIAGHTILSSLGLGKRKLEVIACPTCGRTEIDIISIADEVEERLFGCEIPITVAIMGCEVNGPGEAREADVGICGGRGVGLVFRRGKVIKKVKESELVSALLKEIDKITREKEFDDTAQ